MRCNEDVVELVDNVVANEIFVAVVVIGILSAGAAKLDIIYSESSEESWGITLVLDAVSRLLLCP
jgi:hypothetical protein